MISSSSTHHLVLRLSRRRLPPGLVQYRAYSPIASASSLPLFFDNRRRDSEGNVSGLPTVHNNVLISKTVLERAYPLGLSQSHGIVWFSASTTTKEGEKDKDHKMTSSERRDYYKERAGYYGGKAKSGAKSFGGMMKKYGPVFFVTYMGVYVSTVAGLYVGVESGVMDPTQILDYITGNHEENKTSAEVIADILGKYRLTEGFADTCLEKPRIANLAIAWFATKFTEPIRLAFTASIVPRIARHVYGKKAVEDDEEEEASAAEEEKPADKASADSSTAEKTK